MGDQSKAIAVIAAALGTPAERLRAATQIVRTVLAELNSDSSGCESCGCRVYEDFAEANAAKALEGAIGRMERVVGVLETLASEGGGR